MFYLRPVLQELAGTCKLLARRTFRETIGRAFHGISELSTATRLPKEERHIIMAFKIEEDRQLILFSLSRSFALSNFVYRRSKAVKLRKQLCELCFWRRIP